MSEKTENQSMITADVQITGTIKSAGPLRIDGKLDGEVDCGADVTLGKSAQIKGNLTVNSISVAGTVNGNITARDRIELKSTAKLMGDIKAKRLAVEDGVTFVGKSEVNPTGAAVGGEVKPVPAPEGGEDGKGGLFNKK